MFVRQAFVLFAAARAVVVCGLDVTLYSDQCLLGVVVVLLLVFAHF